MQEIISYLKGCPALSDKVIVEDYLGPKSGSIAVCSDGGEQILKNYTSGDMLCQSAYKIMIRSFFTGEATKILQNVCDYMTDELGDMPTLSEGKVAQYFEVTECPYFVKTEVNAGVYEMKFKLIYYRKGV